MNEFKIGDKAILKVPIGNFHVPGDVIEAIQDKEAAPGWFLANGKANVDWMNRYPEYFEPVKDEKESTAKWLKENRWFIRTGTKERSELVQEWLFEHGYVWFVQGSVPSYLESKYLCNVCIDGSIIGDILQTSNSQHIHKDAQEIILEFQTTIKSVKLPAVETEQEKEIRELQETIDKASARIKAIKEEM